MQLITQSPTLLYLEIVIKHFDSTLKPIYWKSLQAILKTFFTK